MGLVILHDVDSFTCVLGEFCWSWLAGCKQVLLHLKKQENPPIRVFLSGFLIASPGLKI